MNNITRENTDGMVKRLKHNFKQKPDMYDAVCWLGQTFPFSHIITRIRAYEIVFPANTEINGVCRENGVSKQ